MKLWLTCRPDGKYMLTYLKPVIHRVYGTRTLDVYEALGEPTGVMHLCPGGTKALFGVLPRPLVPARVELIAKILRGPDNEADEGEELPATT